MLIRVLENFQGFMYVSMKKTLKTSFREWLTLTKEEYLLIL